MQRHEIEVAMLEQQPAHSVFQDVTSSDPGHAQLAGLIWKRAQQIELDVALFRHAGFPFASGPRRSRRAQRRQVVLSSFRSIRRCSVCARTQRRSFAFRSEQQPVQFRLVVH